MAVEIYYTSIETYMTAYICTGRVPVFLTFYAGGNAHEKHTPQYRRSHLNYPREGL